MKDTFGKRVYKCECGALAEEFVWDSEIKKYKFSCAKCSKELGHEQIQAKQAAEAPAIRTPTKNR